MTAGWWRGRRGEWYVVGQVVLIALVFAGPRRWSGWPPSPLPFPATRLWFGLLLILLGGALFVAGVLRLGSNLTPLPYPRDDGMLVREGAYGLVRHPLYGGGLIAALGWAAVTGSVPVLVYAAALFVLLDVKARREEEWLAGKYPAYRQYRRSVRKLIPFVY